MDPIILEIIGYVAGFLTTICMLPQLIKILISKSAKDVSLLTFFVLICGEILWIVYGMYVNDMRIIIPNIISCCLSILIFFATIHYIYNQKAYIT
jgi:MtN3 and saliva related transmembrane protein